MIQAASCNNYMTGVTNDHDTNQQRQQRRQSGTSGPPILGLISPLAQSTPSLNWFATALVSRQAVVISDTEAGLGGLRAFKSSRTTTICHNLKHFLKFLLASAKIINFTCGISVFYDSFLGYSTKSEKVVYKHLVLAELLSTTVLLTSKFTSARTTERR